MTYPGVVGKSIICRILSDSTGLRSRYELGIGSIRRAGWVLAYTQWMSCLGFSDLFEVAPLDWVIGSYHPLHEAPEDKFAGIVIEKWNKAQADKKGLKAARKAAGLTQKQLATQSGVKLRAIQLYEQNQLDLRRASVSSALALANTLNCAIEDLVWQPIALEYDSQPCSSENIKTESIAV